MTKINTKEHIIKVLELSPHPKEGGYFKRTYESDLSSDREGKSRRLLTSIYYLLCDDNNIGLLHKNRSDIIHYFHCGAPIHYVTVSPEGLLEKFILGTNIAAGERPQQLVKGGYWKASILPKGEYGLISEAISPGFEYTDNTIADRDIIKTSHPDLLNELSTFLK